MLAPTKKQSIEPVQPMTADRMFFALCKQKEFRKLNPISIKFEDIDHPGCTNCAQLIPNQGEHCTCGLVYRTENDQLRMDHGEHIRRGMKQYHKMYNQFSAVK